MTAPQSSVANALLLALLCSCTSTRETLPANCGAELISQEEAVRLIRACKVTRVYQAHTGPVALRKKDGSSACFYQPRIDWVFGVTAGVCPDSPIVEFTE